MKRIITSFLFCLVCASMSAQYNPLQSQYLLNRIVINPACAGMDGYLSTTASYRRQWLGFDGAPETFAFTANTPLRNKKFNAGIVASQDNIAVLHQSHVSLMYAYRIFTRKVSFSAGFQPGVSFVRNAWNDVQTTSQGDAAYQSAETHMNFDLGYGLYMQSKRFFIGISSSANFISPEALKQPVILANTGYTFGDPKRTAFTFSVLGRFMPQNFYQADINGIVTLRERISFGASYRHKDAVVGIVQVNVNEQLNVGYSYDYTLSHLSTYSSGTHELLLRYDFYFKVNSKSPRQPSR